MAPAGKKQKTQTALTLAELIQTRRNQVILRQAYFSLLLRACFIVLCGWLLFSQVFVLTQVKGNAMFPALKDGDLVLGFRLQQDFHKNDLILYDRGQGLEIRRLIGQGSDVINLGESGNLSLNGTSQAGEIMYPTYAKQGYDYPYKVPANHFFVLGDYRTQTEDSRDFGPLSREQIKGKVITLLRRRGL